MGDQLVSLKRQTVGGGGQGTTPRARTEKQKETLRGRDTSERGNSKTSKNRFVERESREGQWMGNCERGGGENDAGEKSKTRSTKVSRGMLKGGDAPFLCGPTHPTQKKMVKPEPSRRSYGGFKVALSRGKVPARGGKEGGGGEKESSTSKKKPSHHYKEPLYTQKSTLQGRCTGTTSILSKRALDLKKMPGPPTIKTSDRPGVNSSFQEGAERIEISIASLRSETRKAVKLSRN